MGISRARYRARRSQAQHCRCGYPCAGVDFFTCSRRRPAGDVAYTNSSASTLSRNNSRIAWRNSKHFAAEAPVLERVPVTRLRAAHAAQQDLTHGADQIALEGLPPRLEVVDLDHLDRNLFKPGLDGGPPVMLAIDDGERIVAVAARSAPRDLGEVGKQLSVAGKAVGDQIIDAASRLRGQAHRQRLGGGVAGR